MPKMLNTGYFDSGYYTVKKLLEIQGVERHQLEAAMHYVSFPPPYMKIGRDRLWQKEVVEPYLPGIRDFLTGNTFLRKRDEIIADLRAWVREQDLTKPEALRLQSEYLRWTSKGYTSHKVQYYGTWIVLVLKAMREPT